VTRPVGRTTREVKLRLAPADATTLRQLAAALGQPASAVVAYLLRKEVDGMPSSSLDRLAAVRLSAADVARREPERAERPEHNEG
jgi:hypothetical protein